MGNRNANQGASPTEWAEGPPPTQDNEPESERSSRQAHIQDRHHHRILPKAETGVIDVAMILGDAREDDNAQDAMLTTAETRAMNDPQQEMQTPSALIVEDAFELAEILQITLRRMKISAVHESFGSRAFERYNELQPDLVLLDISLPDIPGWQVLENIREQNRATGGTMPIVIVITAFGDPANRLIGKLQGVYRYLIKPFTPREVEQVVREALSSQLG